MCPFRRSMVRRLTRKCRDSRPVARRLLMQSAMTPPAPASGSNASEGYLWARWLFLRALGFIFFSAFYSLAFQIHGLIGEQGILPAGLYLETLAANLGDFMRVWAAPSLFWLGSGDRALTVGVAAGMIASVLLVANIFPKL